MIHYCILSCIQEICITSAWCEFLSEYIQDCDTRLIGLKSRTVLIVHLCFVILHLLTLFACYAIKHLATK